MLRLTFDKKWIDAYWLEINPKVISGISNFEDKEYWVAKENSQAIAELNRIAHSLPAIANLPVSNDVEQKAIQLMRVLSYLPLKTSIAAFGWLGALSENSHKWNYIINVIANKMIIEKESVHESDFIHARILTTRINLFNFLTEYEKHFLSDETMRLSLMVHAENLVQGR